jgi:hypothetical protein
LVVVAGNLTGIRYRDEIVQPYVIPFIQAQANNVTFQQDNANEIQKRNLYFRSYQKYDFQIFIGLMKRK